jgi:hypothetical protein
MSIGCKLFLRFIAVGLLLFLPAVSIAQDAQTEKRCGEQLDNSLRQWSISSVTGEVAEWAKSRRMNPTFVQGDFDGDGRADIALLIQNRSEPSLEYPERAYSSLVAVCLSRPTSVTLHLLKEPYCSDLIARSPKGERYYDFETDRRGTYPSDGVKTVCFEKASATYVYEKQAGSFRRIVDGD